MKYVSISKKDSLNSASNRLVARLRSLKHTNYREQKIVFRPNHEFADVAWIEKKGIWFARKPRRDHFWFPLGTMRPSQSAPLRITVEINTPRSASHGRAGLILADRDGNLHLAHTGRVGGGVTGVNRENFLRFHGLNRNDVIEYDSGKIAICLGAIDSPKLLHNISNFVHEVDEFKKLGSTQAFSNVELDKGKLFQPKFVGMITRHSVGSGKAKLLHDLVCDALNKKLSPPGGRYSRRRDLFLTAKNGAISDLYEVKTDCSSTSIYTAVGQLLLNGYAETRKPRLFLVVPGKPDAQCRTTLTRLGIDVISYHWENGIPIFPKDL